MLKVHLHPESEMASLHLQSQHSSVEEFTSSTLPLPTILVPRSHALKLLELSEHAEMTPTVRSDSQESSNGIAGCANGSARKNPHVLVTQMALLLYLGEYIHARHLWRRHRRDPSLPENGDNSDYAQLRLLWNAAKYCYLWSTGGIHSLGSCLLPSPNRSTNNMLVEIKDFKSESPDTLPFSTLALREFQSCHSTGMEPLSTYSGELLGVFRSRVNLALHSCFDKLDCNEFCVRMNLEGELWNAFGWKKEGSFLVSDGYEESENDVDDSTTEFVEKRDKDNVGKLTDIVMFLEGKMNV